MSVTLDSFVGNKKVVTLLQQLIDSPGTQDLLPHLLFSGPKGHGKTTLARIIANSLGKNLIEANCVAMESHNDLWACFKLLKNPGDVIFLDEIHRLKKPLQEGLYEAMLSWKFQRITGRGQNRALNMEKIIPFTLLGATTREDKLLGPFLDRFDIKIEIQPYNYQEMMEMAQLYFGNYLHTKNVDYNTQGAFLGMLASYSRGIPRLLEKRIDLFKKLGGTSIKNFEDLMHNMNIFPLGITSTELKIMRNLIEHEPISLSGLSSKLQIEEEVIDELHEPYLIQLDFIERTKQGRIIKEGGRAYLEKLQKKTSPSPHLKLLSA